MRILIVGSLHHIKGKEREEMRPHFERICRAIGAQVALRGHSLIVGSGSKDCADLYFAEGAVNSGLPVHLIVIRALTGDTAFPDWKDREGVASFNRKIQATSQWRDTRVHQVRDADAVMLIGGDKGTKDTFEQALQIGRPVVPLGFVGGMSESLLAKLFADELITEGSFQALKDMNAWDRGTSPQVAVQLVEQLFKQQPFLARYVCYFRAATNGIDLTGIFWSTIKWFAVAVAGTAVALMTQEYWGKF